METAHFSITSVNIYQATRRLKLENNKLRRHLVGTYSVTVNYINIMYNVRSARDISMYLHSLHNLKPHFSYSLVVYTVCVYV
jgi:hypothetical protein